MAGDIHVDWLRVAQVHVPGTRLPIVARTFKDETEIESGEQWRTYTGVHVEGSFSSNVFVHCDGSRVTVSGNPSRFDQPDSLFGVANVSDGIDVWNRLLNRCGLPPFTWRDDVLHEYDAKVGRVDVTTNLAVGGDYVMGTLRWLARQSHRQHMGELKPNGRTTAFCEGSRYAMFKYYDKAWQLLNFGSGAWHRRLSEYCGQHGVVRHELTLHPKGLRARGLDWPANWLDDNVMKNLLQFYSVHNRVESAPDMGSIESQLLEHGIPARKASQAALIAAAWLGGANIRDKYKRAQYYRYRKILSLVGIDISTVSDARKPSHVYVPIAVKPLPVPDWYYTERPAA